MSTGVLGGQDGSSPLRCCRFLGKQGRNHIEGYGILGQDEPVLGVELLPVLSAMR
jgi:hypothetical protein